MAYRGIRGGRRLEDRMHEDIKLAEEIDNNKKAGLVYIVRAGALGNPVKIGFVWNENRLRKRIQDIQHGNHERLVVIRTMPGLNQTEKWMHRHFWHLRITGEWYRFDPEMLTVSPPRPSVYNLTATERNILLHHIRESEARSLGLAVVAPLYGEYRERLMRAVDEDEEKST